MSDQSDTGTVQTEAPTRREILLEWLESKYVVYGFISFCLLNLMFTASFFIHYYVTALSYMADAAEMTSPGLVAVDGLVWLTLLLAVVFADQIESRVFGNE